MNPERVSRIRLRKALFLPAIVLAAEHAGGLSTLLSEMVGGEVGLVQRM
jgi:hypothetical protein